MVCVYISKDINEAPNKNFIQAAYCTILLAQYELAKASGLALNTNPMLRM